MKHRVVNVPGEAEDRRASAPRPEHCNAFGGMHENEKARDPVGPLWFGSPLCIIFNFHFTLGDRIFFYLNFVPELLNLRFGKTLSVLKA
jgi:hypothetical protein